MSTEQTANCVVVNPWGGTLTNVVLRHRYSNNPSYSRMTTGSAGRASRTSTAR
ncbi:hypothetical protein [Corallococcus sp. 4LFB]|uniref:hypothetical protein n=1 Tax=Corallococcus sp. 4LFB TaxID=3383249 RepID=UPI003976AF00